MLQSMPEMETDMDAEKYIVPGWAEKFPVGSHLDVMKNSTVVQKLLLDEKKAYYFGRNPQLCDIVIDHASCSRIHAVVMYHSVLKRGFLVDLGSSHGTFIGKVRLPPFQPQNVEFNQEFRFGASTRAYCLRPPSEKFEKGSQSFGEPMDIGANESSNDEAVLDALTEYNTALNRQLPIIMEDAPKPLNRKRKAKCVSFVDEEEIINPEDVDPNVGRFRNLVQTAVIPKKKQHMVEQAETTIEKNLEPVKKIMQATNRESGSSVSRPKHPLRINLAPEVELYERTLPDPKNDSKAEQGIAETSKSARDSSSGREKEKKKKILARKSSESTSALRTWKNECLRFNFSMPGQQFEYDERGSTFYYFLASFYAFVLLPLTYYFWPREKERERNSDVKRCRCEPCIQKEAARRSKEPYKNLKRKIIKFHLLVGWAGLICIIYKAVNIEIEGAEYDPYAILNLDSSATLAEIKKQYRKLSMEHHPDRGGDSKVFVAIAKAYQALTDEDTRRNYEEYGNPDGPGALRFGIALPSWLISKEYAIWVLGIYALLFMIVLPVVVGSWWFRSIKYSADCVLLDTRQMYKYMFHRTPNLVPKRLLTILSGSYEFFKVCNSEIIERPSDDVEVPNLIKLLPNLGETKKERPFCFPYSVKARALIYAQLKRIPLPPKTLRQDANYIAKKSILLIQEMIKVHAHLVNLALMGRISRMPTLESLDNTMKLGPMFIQAMMESKHPLMQLPHFSDEIIRSIVTKKRNVRTCADLAALPEVERRSLLKALSDRQYQDVISVLSSMPNIDMSVQFVVRDDDDNDTITAGALVTCVVKLCRTALLDVPGNHGKRAAQQQWKSAELSSAVSVATDSEGASNPEKDSNGYSSVQDNGSLVDGKEATNKRKVWEKVKKKKKKYVPKCANNNKRKPAIKKPLPKTVEPAKTVPEKQQDEADLDVEGSGNDSDDSMNKPDNAKDSGDGSEDEEYLLNDPDLKKERAILETKSNVTHPVHCPYFCEEKFEWWWIFVCDRKRRLLVAPPIHVTTLVNEEEIEIKFPAPIKPGQYVFQVCLRSDSYVDFCQFKDVKFKVHEACEILTHPQWDFSEEKTDEEQLDESEFTEYEDEEESS
ncbi:Translocation protein SEC63 -like protein [Trichinella zimbabwensis]|uniref:Translocation protein SEC63-like protein n=1 Tax=Trichinella zimbabwensis TaxID=268475 RepID=A0A0V1HHT1_9BILA|nr:Translocation protein SEC63 -like protein [Trichinella zimbabwensis]